MGAEKHCNRLHATCHNPHFPTEFSLILKNVCPDPKCLLSLQTVPTTENGQRQPQVVSHDPQRDHLKTCPAEGEAHAGCDILRAATREKSANALLQSPVMAFRRAHREDWDAGNAP